MGGLPDDRARLIVKRCDASKLDCGLTYYSGVRGPTRDDVKVGNNFLARLEAETKQRMTDMWLSFVEDQLDQGKLPTMASVREKMVGFIKFNGWQLLLDKGRTKRPAADRTP